MPRSYSLLFVSSMFFLSQVIAVNVNYIASLWMVSAAVGLAYGSVFSLLPTVCLEWFGMRKSFHPVHYRPPLTRHTAHFSENWGFLSLSPMVAGNLFSLIFGRNLDAHEHDSRNHPTLSHTQYTSSLLSITKAAPQCLQGRECYVDTLYLTVSATFLSILLSLLAAYRDKRKIERSIVKREALLRNSGRPGGGQDETSPLHV